jgi:hypothetical protein
LFGAYRSIAAPVDHQQRSAPERAHRSPRVGDRSHERGEWGVLGEVTARGERDGAHEWVLGANDDGEVSAKRIPGDCEAPRVDSGLTGEVGNRAVRLAHRQSPFLHDGNGIVERQSLDPGFARTVERQVDRQTGHTVV